MLGSATGPGGGAQRGLWPLAPAPTSAASFTADSLSKYGVYSLFPPTFGSALYSHASTIGRFGHIQQSAAGNTFHAAHKVSDSLFSSGYTFGAPTPPPGSPYSPIPVAQLELLAKGLAAAGPVVVQPAVEAAPAVAAPAPMPASPRRACAERCCAAAPRKGGCSRTCPLDWAAVSVKKEPGAQHPCQVAEVSTTGAAVKLEAASPTQKVADGAANIPLGITLTRQRLQQEVITSPCSLSTAGLLTTVGTGGATIKELGPPTPPTAVVGAGGGVATPPPAAVAGMAAGAPQGAAAAADDRAPPLAGWAAGGGAAAAAAHGQALAPALWQYPAPVPVEPMVPLPVPMPPVGFQLVRDPNTGGLLLLPTTTGIEPLQQTVVWPSYPQQPQVILPSISSMQPPPLQLLSSTSSDFLSSSTTLHQHTQTHSTRLVAVTTDAKRKIPLPIPATTLIKIETDATTLDQTKTLQSVSTIASNTGTVFTDQNMAPLVTTHVIYQHPTNLILSQTPSNAETACRSQATSPVTCLTPPPEVIQAHEEEQSTVQDASNQTDTPICSEDDNTSHTISDVLADDKKIGEVHLEKVEEVPEFPVLPVPEENKEVAFVRQPEPSSTTCEEQIPVPVVDEVQETPSEAEDSDVVNQTVQKPDLSGLELLSNSIEEFESCRSTSIIEEVSPVEDKIEIKEKTLTPTPIVEKEETPEQIWPKPVDDSSLVGLDLLCALAEQRIMEENIEQPARIEKEKSKDKERRREKRKSKKHSHDEPRRKKMKSEKRHSSESRERKQKRREERQYEKSEKEKEVEKILCSCKDKYRKYKTPESEEEAKKFIASKSQTICCKGEWPCMNAMELDMRMKLADLQRQYREKQKELSKLKPKKHECSKKKSRKKSTHSDRSTPPPLLDKMDVPVKPNRDTSDLLKPPTLCAMPKIEDIYKAHSLDEYSPEKTSKKRKVGTPKKIQTPTGEIVATETIVAKKPKSNFVGYLLAAKEKLKMQSKVYSNTTPPRYIEELSSPKPKKNKNNNHIITDDLKSSKIKPKLRAEATVKCTAEEDEIEEDNDVIDHIEEDMDEEEVEAEPEPEPTVEEPPRVEEKSEEAAEPANPCALTEKHLEVDKLRVLTAMGGLFYAGHLNAVEPPDVYSITLDGERGNRPHIMSREEILRDAIVEVSPKNVDELPYGTRLCAYWSQQYRCLYPGSVAEPGTPDPHLDGKFVSVEFDDGDSGKIAIEDIRLLPPNYPIIEYDPNPLLSLSKRRRRTSTSVSTDDSKRHVNSAPVQVASADLQAAPKLAEEPKEEKTDVVKVESSSEHKEKKRLKKKKREKLRQKLLKHDTKKKKRKHKCVDENCKHKKHKKHRKHKKHHRNEESNAEVVSTSEEMAVDRALPTIDEVDEEGEEADDSSSKQEEEFPEYHIVPNPEDEVTMDDIIEATQTKKSKKIRDRQESCESRSKMSAFLPARQFWNWSGKGYKRRSAKGRSKKSFYKSIQRGKETITVGDSAVFLSTGRPDRPYIGRIEAMWELCGTMVVKVKWFYHPEETVGCPMNLQYPGALFESPHVDENDVQTISHKCEVLPLKEYTERLGDDPQRYASIYDNNDIYYLAGYYDPTTMTLKMEPGIPFSKSD